jgi:dTDP-glucose pyrophosphorylase
MIRKVNLIPMAGAGRRFADAGYKEPKPLVLVDGEPMVVRAAQALPPCDQWIFVCQEAHVKEARLAEKLALYFNPMRVITVDGVTEGQACTCLLAKEYLNSDDVVNIGACDNYMAYAHERYDEFLNDDRTDALIWTFRNNPAVLQDPRMYGWVRVDSHGKALGVSCKAPISDEPMRDHAVIGAFSFRRAADFIGCTEQTIAANRRIKNEFYMDEVMNVAIESGRRVEVFEVDDYVCWGTPQDLDVYRRNCRRKSGASATPRQAARVAP